MSLQVKRLLSPQEYLAFERQAKTKNEYYAGEVFAMAGASRRHVKITVNTIVSLAAQLKERPCEVFTGDMRVKVSATGLYTYPDVAIVCGKPRFDDEQEDTLLNPTVIVEVLSKSTETYDRTEKFAHYRNLESLTDYLLIDQESPHIEQYTRRSDGSWSFSDGIGLDQGITIDSIQCRLSLAEVYDKVDFTGQTRAPRFCRNALSTEQSLRSPTSCSNKS
jgi:Uma2 family endonuclease